MAHHYSKQSKREFLQPFFRFKRRGIIAFVATIIVAAIGLFLCPRKYSSEAKLLVRLGRENLALDPTATTGALISLNNTREAEINSVILALSSRSNMEEVLDRLEGKDAFDFPMSREKALTKLMKNISVSSPKTSTVVVLSALASTPERAQQVVKEMLDVGLNEHVRVNRTQGSYSFFAEQEKLMKSRLDAASVALRDAKNKYGIITLDGRRTALQQQLTAVELQMQDTKSSLKSSQAKIDEMEKGIAQLPTELIQQMIGGAPNSTLSNMRQKLYELQTSEQALLASKTSAHPKVLAIEEQVKASKEILDKEAPKHQEAASALLTTERSQAASLTARENSLEEEHKRLLKELEELNKHELDIVELERQVKLLDASYESYVKGLEQSRIDDALKNEKISNLSVIQSPSFVPKPAVPKNGIVLMLAVLAAGANAVVIMFLSDYFDETLRNASGIERLLNQRVFISLPRIEQAPAKSPAA